MIAGIAAIKANHLSARRAGIMLRVSLLLLMCWIVAGCAATGALREVVPPQLADEARVVGVTGEDVRIWGDEPPHDLERIAEKFHQQRRAALAAAGLRPPRFQNMLVISGGGADGAFGAGLLNGWTARGDRPEFVIVTGVSTGALMAPFAFLGPAYDGVLKEFYTRYSTKDILRPTVLAGILGGNTAIGSSEPLANLIKKYLSPQVMRAIAAEHRKGRRLLIGTTNLDAERPVIWNFGEIASNGSKSALDLMRKVLLASASIPGLFPPVLIDVKVQGKVRQEMHVDGGTTDNAILLPQRTNVRLIDKGGRRHPRRRLYVLVNSHTNPEWQSVKSSTMAIAGRSILTLIKQQTLGDLLKLYDFAKVNKIDFNLATIPPDFKEKGEEPFDRVYMTKLFALGERYGREGYQWKKQPPIR